jgi:hypothetical protein
MRELTYRLIDMAPEAPPFPEEPMVQLKPSPTPASPARRRLGPVWVAAAAAAAVILLGTPLLLINLDDSTDLSTPATQVTAPETVATTLPDQPTPTTVDPAPVTTTVPATPALPELSAGTVVIAQPGAETAADNGVVVYDADVAVADESGGLVIQRAQTILQVGPDGTEFVLLDAAPFTAEYGPLTLRLQDVTEYFSVPNAVIVAGYGQEYPDVFQEIWLLDLNSGAIESVYRLVAVESNIVRVSAEAGTMIASVSSEAGTEFVYLTTGGQPITVPGPYADTQFGGPEYPELLSQAVLSPSARNFAYIEIADIQTYEDGFLAADLVIWDADTGTEVQRVDIELIDGAWPARLDYNGGTAVLGLQNLNTDTVLPPLRIDLGNGSIAELSTAGTPSLVKTGGMATAEPAAEDGE